MPMTNVEDAPVAPRRERDIAIVGMACVMPGAPDVETFWSNIVDGVDSVTEVPESRWVHAAHYVPDHDASARGPGSEPMSVSKWGGFVPDVGFDALRWGIPPASLASIDPAQLMALKAAADALDDAGYGEGGFDRERTSVVVATGSGGASDLPAGFLLRLLLRTHGIPHADLPAELDAFLPELTEDGLPGVLTSVIAGRVANRLDLGGKNLTVDSACASVLVALDIACNELTSRSSEMVLLGGVDLHNGPQDYVSFSAAQALSPSGRCRSFDTAADGMTLAEGVGCLVLKRLADASRDGDRIYAVVRGVAGSSDGRHLGLTAPNQAGQVKAVVRTYAEAGMSPTDVGLVEAHGTGTPTGDRIELGSTTEVFTAAGAAPGSAVLGSVKSNIGHVKCAAGIASLIKAAKSLYHGVQPPTLHVEEPIEVWDQDTSPFVFLDRARPWLDDRRVAAVSGFGFGGTNFHAVLDDDRAPADTPSAPGAEPAVGRHHWPAELIALRAVDDAALAARLTELAERLTAALQDTAADRWRLRDIAAAESAQLPAAPVRLAIVAHDLTDLAAKVTAAATGQTPSGVHRADPSLVGETGRDSGWGSGSESGPRVAFLLPGRTAVARSMAADLLVAFPRLRAVLDSGRRWADTMFPPTAFGDAAARRDAALAEAADPAVALAGLVHTGALGMVGVVPDHVVGGGHPWPDGSTADADEGGDTDDEVRVADQVRALHAAGVRVFVEAGPGCGLATLAARTLGEVPHLAVAIDEPGEHGLVGFLRTVAALAVAGLAVDLGALHAGRDSDSVRWDEPPRAAGWVVNGHCARTAAGDPLPKGLRPATEAPPLHIGGGSAAASAAVPLPGAAPVPSGNGLSNGLAPGDIAVVAEYLRILQGVITAGSDIVRGQVAAQAGAENN